MRARYVLDTNVLIAASAADPANPKDIDATPQDPEWRRKVWSWLDAFDHSDARLVLDDALKILDEYTGSRMLDHQAYGIQVVIHKWSTSAVDNVPVTYDEHGHGLLPATLAPTIHDLEDRKMVAAALASYAQFGEGCVAFAGDTDWHGWEDALTQHHVFLEPVIEAWSRGKYEQKKHR